jgi:ATP-dependent protease ClpP protease subunit
VSTEFRKHYIQLLASDLSGVTVAINSGGGDVNAGMGIYNILAGCELPVTTVNMGEVGSIAATIFMAGTVRIAVPDSYFVLHAATYLDGDDKGKVASSTQLLAAPFRRIASWRDEAVDRYFGTGNETILLPNEALRLGMLTEIAQYRVGLNQPVIDLVTSNSAPK